MWILIVMHLDSSAMDFINMQEFTTKTSCENAAKFIIDNSHVYEKTWIKTACLAK